MIEIALDKNPDNTFKNKEYPVFEVQQFADNSFNTYLFTAQNIINHFISEPIIIIKILTDSCSLNFLALALFIKSYQIESCLECVVFKVTDYEQALQSYKPFIALTTGIRLALRLCDSPAVEIYREIENMGYLGLNIKRDYLKNIIKLDLNGNNTPVLQLNAQTLSQAVVTAASVKTFALLPQHVSCTAQIDIDKNPQPLNADLIINQILQNTLPVISKQEVTF